MHERPLVSIGMPVYNGSRHIRDALDSLLAQEYEHFELIISDNASTDDTGVICREYADRDTRVRYHRHASTVSPYQNFNGLVAHARGPLFMWAAHDDVWEPGFVGALVSALQASPDAVLAFSQFDNIDASGRRVRVFGRDWGRVFSRPRILQYAYLILLNEFRTQKANHVYGLMRKEALVACGGVIGTAVGNSGEDIMLLLRLLARGRFVIVHDVLFHYRIREPARHRSEDLIPYVLRSILRNTPGYRGTGNLFVVRNYTLHADMASTLLRDGTLPLLARLGLAFVSMLKGVWYHARMILIIAARELGFLR